MPGGRIVVSNGEDDFDQAFSNHVHDHKGVFAYPFVCQLLIYKDIPPRDERFEFIREIGMGKLEDIMNLKSCGLSGNLTFMFPERWLSVHETRAFMWAIMKNPDVAKIKRVRVATSSPIIPSDFHREDVRVMGYPNPETQRTVAARDGKHK